MPYTLIIGSYKQVAEFEESPDAWNYVVENLWLDSTVHVIESSKTEEIQAIFEKYDITDIPQTRDTSDEMIKVSGIIYNTDEGEDVSHLPTELLFELSDFDSEYASGIEYEVADKVSDVTGFLVDSCSFTLVTKD